MFERLSSHAEKRAEQVAEQTRDRLLARTQLPLGVTAEEIEGGIALVGKRLRRRLITDANLRNFGR